MALLGTINAEKMSFANDCFRIHSGRRSGDPKNYQKFEKLGEGTYASVYRGLCLASQERCAIKEIKLDKNEGIPCTALREASILRGLKHANIVCLVDILSMADGLSFVFEHLSMDLKKYMEVHGNLLDVSRAKIILKDLLCGSEYFHKANIIHRDLKPQNILIGENGQVKIADFGLARRKGIAVETFSNEVVTLWYRAPEVLLGVQDYGTGLDIWSLGCIFAEMVMGKALFSGGDKSKQIFEIVRKLGLPCLRSEGLDKELDRQYYRRRVILHAKLVVALKPILQVLDTHGEILQEELDKIHLDERCYYGLATIDHETEGLHRQRPELAVVRDAQDRIQQLIVLCPRLNRLELNLLGEMLSYDYDRRISSTIALQHLALC